MFLYIFFKYLYVYMYFLPVISRVPLPPSLSPSFFLFLASHSVTLCEWSWQLLKSHKPPAVVGFAWFFFSTPLLFTSLFYNWRVKNRSTIFNVFNLRRVIVDIYMSNCVRISKNNSNNMYIELKRKALKTKSDMKNNVCSLWEILQDVRMTDTFYTREINEVKVNPRSDNIIQ